MRAIDYFDQDQKIPTDYNYSSLGRYLSIVNFYLFLKMKYLSAFNPGRKGFRLDLYMRVS